MSVPQSLIITAAQRAAYATRVTANDENRTLVQHLNALAESLSAPSGTVAYSLLSSNSYGSAFITTPLAEAWLFESNPSPLAVRSVFLPWADHLGVDPDLHKVEIRAGLVCSDPNQTEDLMNVRLIDMSTGLPIAGSEASAELSGADQDQVILGPWVEAPATNHSYLIDFRKQNDNSNSTATARNQILYIRIVMR